MGNVNVPSTSASKHAIRLMKKKPDYTTQHLTPKAFYRLLRSLRRIRAKGGW
jgi:hypothetical protein